MPHLWLEAENTYHLALDYQLPESVQLLRISSAGDPFVSPRVAALPEPAAPARRRVIIETDWEPHSLEQAAILGAPEDEIDATCGRRFGKTALVRAWLTGIWEGAKWGAVHAPGGRFWYCAPTIRPACKDFYRDLKRALAGLIKSKNDTDLSLVLFNEATIECKSLEVYDNLRGPGLDGLVIDEKGTVPEDAWTTVLAPMLADPPELCRRRVMRVGSARGRRHWTYREHMAGLEGPHGIGGRQAYQFTSLARPGLERYVERMRRSMPSNAFRQEILAEFLDTAAGYFQKIDEAHDGKGVPELPERGAIYTAGMDFAHVDDWSVVAIVQATPKPMRVVALSRWGRSPWPATKARGIDLFTRWSADAMVDATPSGAPGEVTLEAFRPEWTRIEGFDFRSTNGAGREDLLANLAIMLESGALRLPGTYKRPAFPILTSELEGFQYEILPSGRARARAGPNLNDDCVMALALAAWKAKQGIGGYAQSIKTY